MDRATIQVDASEAASVAIAEKQKNASDCWNGWSGCKLSKLSPSEVSEVTVAEHRRNVTQCWDGEVACDRSKLSTTELSAVNVADHQRNYLAASAVLLGVTLHG